ncbi:hypothetical protein WN944_001651 [Citrus x changshan-huyou]|uniref:Uncharacterized protein n=1 Tax=Citrus x changshan-huyou TaxID=2935761 RepID=A0AAP0MF27_9ROSI
MYLLLLLPSLTNDQELQACENMVNLSYCRPLLTVSIGWRTCTSTFGPQTTIFGEWQWCFIYVLVCGGMVLFLYLASGKMVTVT